MSQSGRLTDRSVWLRKYGAAASASHSIMHRLLYFGRAGNEGRRRRFIVLLLAALFMLSMTLLALPFAFELKPMLTFGVWLILGLYCVWIGTGLEYILHPGRLAYRRIVEACGRAVREIADQEILLDWLTHTLYQSLELESLSIWRYRNEDNLLILSRCEGAMAVNNLAELPLDIAMEHLHGTGPVSDLPESAFRQGLIATGARVITSLSSGDELLGLIGLGGPRFDADNGSRETLHWLELMAGQLALAVKNAYLITDLEDTLKKLQLAYRRTIDVEEEERRHLAVELHDAILSRLTTMTLTLRNSQKHVSTDPGQVRGWLGMLEKEMQYVNRRLRGITQGLYPSVLRDLGLISALQAYMDFLAKQALMASAPGVITLTAQGFNDDRFANQKLERDLYYITRQALDNAIAHAQAEQVYIHLRWREDSVSITVRDTGCGMNDVPQVLMGQEGHLGLLAINERVLAWQGRLTFDTAPGQGTTMHVHIPIDQPSPAPTHLQAFSQHLG